MPTKEQNTLLEKCGKGDLVAVKHLIENEHVQKNCMDLLHWTPLMHAVYEGKIDVARYLLSKGVDHSLQNFDARTALHIAANANQKDIVSLLLACEADYLKNRKLPIDLARDKNYTEVVRVIEEKMRADAILFPNMNNNMSEPPSPIRITVISSPGSPTSPSLTKNSFSFTKLKNQMLIEELHEKIEKLEEEVAVYKQQSLQKDQELELIRENLKHNETEFQANVNNLKQQIDDLLLHQTLWQKRVTELLQENDVLVAENEKSKKAKELYSKKIQYLTNKVETILKETGYNDSSSTTAVQHSSPKTSQRSQSFSARSNPPVEEASKSTISSLSEYLKNKLL